MGRTPEDLYSRWVPFGMLTLAQPQPRPAAARAVGVRREVHERIPARGRDAVSAHAVHLRAGEGLVRSRAADAARAVRRVPRRRRLVDGRGRVPVRQRHPRRAALRDRVPRAATSTCRRATGSTTRPARRTARGGTRSRPVPSRSSCSFAMAPRFRTSPWRSRPRSWTGRSSKWTSSRRRPRRRRASWRFPMASSSRSHSSGEVRASSLENPPLAGKVTWTVARRGGLPAVRAGRTQLPD